MLLTNFEAALIDLNETPSVDDPMVAYHAFSQSLSDFRKLGRLSKEQRILFETQKKAFLQFCLEELSKIPMNNNSIIFYKQALYLARDLGNLKTLFDTIYFFKEMLLKHKFIIKNFYFPEFIEITCEYLNLRKEVINAKFEILEQIYLELIELSNQNHLHSNLGELDNLTKSSLYMGLGSAYFKTLAVPPRKKDKIQELYINNAILYYQKALALNPNFNTAHMLAEAFNQYGKFLKNYILNNRNKYAYLLTAAMNCYQHFALLSAQYADIRKLGIAYFKIAQFIIQCDPPKTEGRSNLENAIKYFASSILTLLSYNILGNFLSAEKELVYRNRLVELQQNEKNQFEKFRRLNKEILDNLATSQKLKNLAEIHFFALHPVDTNEPPIKKQKLIETSNESLTDAYDRSFH